MVRVRKFNSSKGSVFWAAIIGNILEYYDFTVCIVFSVEIGKTFFPADSGISQILGALLAFAFGFISRPVGAVVLGYVGDRYGRRSALLCSALGMTFSTFGIGFLPGYGTIGVFAIPLLFVFRMIQGFCISGEGTGAAIFILEHCKVKRLSLMAGVVNSTNIGGTVLATLVSLGLRHFFPDKDFVWRFAFISGGLFGLLALFLRWKVSETPIFAIMQKQKGGVRDGIRKVVKDSWRQMVLTFIIGSFAGSIVQLIKGYVNVYYQDIMGLPAQISLIYLMYTSIVLMISMIVFGALGDMVGKSRVLIGSGIAAIVFSIPALLFMSGPSLSHHIIALTLLALIAGAASASAYAFVILIFEPSQRFFGVSVSYNLGIALFGGTSPLIARGLVEMFGNSYSPAYYIILLAALFLVAMNKTRSFIIPKDYL